MSSFESWGRFPKVDQKVHSPSWVSDGVLPPGTDLLLPYGQGRSYGDACLNDGHTIISTERLNRFISFDAESGVLECEAGTTLEAIIDFALPRGFFLPVTPGTKFVSLGGAIANDVHGKNHHAAGTVGCHIERFTLLRSDGTVTTCSPSEHRELFAATIGGLGLTGIILTAAIRLKRVKNAFIDLESVKFSSLEEFFQISADSDKNFEYTVAWIDCVASGASLGRGIFMRGNHSIVEREAPPKRRPVLSVRFDLPSFALNRLSVSAFNFLYYNKQRERVTRVVQYYDPFFYPLDAVHHWNRIYGKGGFLQFQCVVPSGENNRAIRTILDTIVESGRASFLAVIKEFGEISSPGMMSFPRKGVTLCLDFPYSGAPTESLFCRLDGITREFGGALYPAKDAMMSGESFRQYYPRWEEFSRFIDPRFSSSFWRRVS